jgi:CDP-paratose 2-epimerase
VATVLVTGSGGLVGSQAVRHFAELGYRVAGIDNDARGALLGREGSTAALSRQLRDEYDDFELLELDIRDGAALDAVVRRFSSSLELVVHAAGQPSHEWANAQPRVDFEINANGTLNLLDAVRRHAAEVPFVHMSTNKVYGDRPNRLALTELETRYDLPPDHPSYDGIDTKMSLDRSAHSVLGASKAAADLMVQEYGRLFGMPTVCLRAGCITGPDHAATELHGFLAYVVLCAAAGRPYTVFGYSGKQVRDNLHAVDLVQAIEAVRRRPMPGAVYNIGGGRTSSCSVLEAIELAGRIVGRDLAWTLRDEPRYGDHVWWITDNRELERDCPGWTTARDPEALIRELYEANGDRWARRYAVDGEGPRRAARSQRRARRR